MDERKGKAVRLAEDVIERLDAYAEAESKRLRVTRLSRAAAAERLIRLALEQLDERDGAR
jgi:hypothetical protein